MSAITKAIQETALLLPPLRLAVILGAEFLISVALTVVMVVVALWRGPRQA